MITSNPFYIDYYRISRFSHVSYIYIYIYTLVNNRFAKIADIQLSLPNVLLLFRKSRQPWNIHNLAHSQIQIIALLEHRLANDFGPVLYRGRTQSHTHTHSRLIHCRLAIKYAFTWVHIFVYLKFYSVFRVENGYTKRGAPHFDRLSEYKVK